ncbi:hypothetical protein [Alienimonas sp. DA493]|uniref:hypothetical protein n=1 Tax=Alienimonas sp. DA493 TaxID=3373605 RepID=UPI00375426DB
MRPVRRPSPAAARHGRRSLLAAAALCVAAPTAGAQTFGLVPDGSGAPASASASAKEPNALVSWLTARPGGSVAAAGTGPEVVPAGYRPASGPVATTSGYEVPCVGEAPCGGGTACEPAPQRRLFGGLAPVHGLVPDGGHCPPPAAQSINPPGTRQKESGGLKWPPFPRSTAPRASVKTQLHHAHYWPLPYSCQDRAYVRGLLAAQVAAGRAEHAALHGFHFDPETHLLTNAGRDHLQVAAVAAASAGTVSPIVVAAGAAPEVGAARLAAVREAVVEMGAPQLAPAVSLGVAPLAGRPAEEIDRLRRDELQSTPQPRVPVTNASAVTTGS